MEDFKQQVRAKIEELAGVLGNDASGLGHSDLIPEKAGLDSTAILELMLWFETTFELSIPEDELTVENFGTLDAMESYVTRSKSS